MWGGLKWLPGKTPVKAEGVTVNAWSYDWVDPVVSLQEGYKLINTCDTYLYIVPAAGYYRDFLDHQWIYEKWSPWIMNRKQTLPEGTPGVLGGMFAVWNDKCGNGISEQDVHIAQFPRPAGARREAVERGKQECHLRSICKAVQNNSRSSGN